MSRNRNTYTRSTADQPPRLDRGPYEAIVVSHLDPKYMGGLQVELLKNTSAGNLPERTGQMFEVRYLSPFYGTTPRAAVKEQPGYQYTQSSYGMWFVPPDVGTRVLVIFAEGNPGQGFWIGCVQDDYMNFMLPGYASTSLTRKETPSILKGKKLPVAEYNKKLTDSSNVAEKKPTIFKKSYHKRLALNLIEQGLLEDETRGTTTSSARREVPSAVFGISTPGPIDKKGPKNPLGPYQATANVYTSRLGGSSFVMDDGDDKILRKGSPTNSPSEYVNVERGQKGGDPDFPHNELIRLRTRTGHQILMHNTEDLIYIGNSRGTTWIEMTSNGKIDIYAQDSVSIHTEHDLNVTADRDINFTAFENMNIVVGKDLKIDVGGSINKTAGTHIASNAGTSITENANTFITNYAQESITHTAASDNLTLLSGATVNVGAEGEIGIESNSNIKILACDTMHQYAVNDMFVLTEATYNLHSVGDAFQLSDANIHSKAATSTFITSGTNLELNTGAGQISTAARIDHNTADKIAVEAESSLDAVIPPIPNPIEPVPPLRAGISSRVPQHEPWAEHENLNPNDYTPDRTRAGSEQTQNFAPKSFDTFDTSTTATVDESVAQSSRLNEFDATRAPRDTSQPVSRATRGTVTPLDKVIPAPSEITILGSKTQDYVNTIGTRESGNRYDTINTIGFVGRYQFGTLALKDLGYIKSSASNRNSAMKDDSNWTGKDGITSLVAFLVSKEVQEKAMVDYTNLNYRYLTRIGGIRDGDDLSTIAGMLAGAHLLGAGGMNKWRAGNGGRDAYGTTGDEYFELGKSAVA
jgi:hypothetical protein